MRRDYAVWREDFGQPAWAEVTPPRRWLHRDAYYLNRIEVPEEMRGKGVGTELLLQILADVEVERVKLVLDPIASFPTGSGLDQEQLEAWYLRHGFRWVRRRGHRVMEWDADVA